MMSVFWIGNRGMTFGASVTQDERDVNMCIQVTDASGKVIQLIIPYDQARGIVDKLNHMLTGTWALQNTKEDEDEANIEGGLVRF